MTPAAIERMVSRTYRKMIEAEDFGIRMRWYWAMHRWIRRRPGKGRR